MSAQYVKSNNIKVYPTGFRIASHDYQSQFNTEFYLTQLKRMSEDNALNSYVMVNPNDNTRLLICLGGYYFDVLASAITTGSNGAWAYIKLLDATEQEATHTKPRLDNINSSGSILDDDATATSYFRGIAFDTTEPTTAGSYSYKVKVLINNSTTQTLANRIPLASRLKLTTNEIKDGAKEFPISQSFHSTNISVTNLDVTGSALMKEIRYSDATNKFKISKVGLDVNNFEIDGTTLKLNNAFITLDSNTTSITGDTSIKGTFDIKNSDNNTVLNINKSNSVTSLYGNLDVYKGGAKAFSININPTVPIIEVSSILTSTQNMNLTSGVFHIYGNATTKTALKVSPSASTPFVYVGNDGNSGEFKCDWTSTFFDNVTFDSNTYFNDDATFNDNVSIASGKKLTLTGLGTGMLKINSGEVKLYTPTYYRHTLKLDITIPDIGQSPLLTVSFYNTTSTALTNSDKDKLLVALLDKKCIWSQSFEGGAMGTPKAVVTYIASRSTSPSVSSPIVVEYYKVSGAESSTPSLETVNGLYIYYTTNFSISNDFVEEIIN